MANRYWVLGTGTWDSTNTVNWSDSSGGLGGFSVPTAADNVFFDANSNVGIGTFTVTMANTPRVCNDFTAAGLDGTMTLAGAAIGLTVSGSLTFQATNFTRTYTGVTTFNATTTGKTVTTNGVAFGQDVLFDGVGGSWTLGSAINTGAFTLQLNRGTFDTSINNYSVATGSFSSNNSNARTINLNASTISTTSFNFWNTSTSTNLTLNAGTSTISSTNTLANFSGGGKTYYNVAFTSTALNIPAISGANTFNNLSITGRTSIGIGIFTIAANQTINGTLTVSAGIASAYRISIVSNGIGVTRTLTCAAVSFTDTDFRDITIAGAASPATGTRLGDCKGNSGITFPAAKTVYYRVTGSANWGSTGSGAWSATSGGSADATMFPLAQDTAVFPAATYPASGSTTTINAAYNIGTIDMSLRTSNTMTLATSTNIPVIYGNWTNGTGITISGSQQISFFGRTTQTITSAGRSFTQNIFINSPSGSVTLQDAFTSGSTFALTLTNGTLDIQSYTLSIGSFSSSNSNTRTIAFGTGQISCTGTGTVWDTATVTGLTTTGTQVVNVTSTATTPTTITVATGSLSEANSISFNFTGGTYELTFLGSSNYSARNANFTGFAGTLAQIGITTPIIYGNLTLSTGMTLTSSTRTLVFGATSGTQQITTNAKTIDFPINFNGVGGTFQLQDDLTMGSTRAVALTNGTLDLFGKTFTAGTAFNIATGTKNLTFNGGTLVCPAASTSAFNNAQPTGFTTTAGTGTGAISMTAATAKTFVGGGSTFNCTLNQGGAGALTITGSNTFSNITNTVQPASVLFTAGTTSTFSNFSLSGTAGNLITIGSVTATSHTLSKASGTVSADFLSISRSTATGGATWNAGANSTDGGNNLGWIFGAAPVNGTANVTGVEATGAVGTVTASGGTVLNGDAYPTGVQAISAVGTVTASGDASNNLTGVQSTGTVGITTATGAANTDLTGVQATGQVGTVTATGGGTGAGNAYVIGVEAIGSVGNVTAEGGGYPVWPNGGLGYPFIIEPDRINPARNATANVKSAYILSAVGKVSAFGTIVINANVSVQAILHEIKINSMSARGIQNPTDEEWIDILMMD
jgi:hypothetical protein